jgi:hypothetical protein
VAHTISCLQNMEVGGTEQDHVEMIISKLTDLLSYFHTFLHASVSFFIVLRLDSTLERGGV